MRIVLLILLLAAMAGVVYVLVRGVIAMASGKDVTGEQSQMWMRRRVLFQAVAIVTHAEGRRLAKRDLAPTLAAMREAGIDGRALAADLLAGKLPLGFAFADA